MPAFERYLETFGFGVYSIDYTQHFPGVLDCEALVHYLQESKGFCAQGGFAAAMEEEQPTILENTASVKKHVCTWIATAKDDRTVRTKIYNKIFSNFEAGEIREPVGGHLANYVDCPNKCLRHTFLHPDVQARGCTRIEVSLSTCPRVKLSTEKADEVVQKALAKVSPEGVELFMLQPSRKQWENLASCLDRCLVLADRPQGQIFVAWCAHIGTGRISGVHVCPTKLNV